MAVSCIEISSRGEDNAPTFRSIHLSVAYPAIDGPAKMDIRVREEGSGADKKLAPNVSCSLIIITGSDGKIIEYN